MSLSVVVRRLVCACAALLLLGLAWWAVSGGLRDLVQARTGGQKLETVVRLACAALSVAVVVTRFRWRAVSRAVRIAWAIAVAGVAGLSPLVWGPPMPHIAALFAGVALVLAWGIVWALGPALPAWHRAGRRFQGSDRRSVPAARAVSIRDGR
jgi:hypothetical protein